MKSCMDGFPSGQRGQTVNLLQIASVVRIHLHPLTDRSRHCVSWCGGIGRRKGLKIPRGQPRAGSSPATSSKNPAEMLDFLCVKVFTLFYTVLWSNKSRYKPIASDDACVDLSQSLFVLEI